MAESKQFLSPPRAVDVAWHAFILHTRDYESSCRERYGRVIHHQPTGEPDPEAYERAYAKRSADRTPIDHTIWDPPPGLTHGLFLGGAAGEAESEERGDGQRAEAGGNPGSEGGGTDDGGTDGGGTGGGGDSGGSRCGGGSSSCGGGSG